MMLMPQMILMSRTHDADATDDSDVKDVTDANGDQALSRSAEEFDDEEGDDVGPPDGALLGTEANETDMPSRGRENFAQFCEANTFFAPLTDTEEVSGIRLMDGLRKSKTPTSTHSQRHNGVTFTGKGHTTCSKNGAKGCWIQPMRWKRQPSF